MTSDPLLAALADARQRKQQADHDLRLLLAYAREIVTPRPYRLADLAQAAGISISGVRVAYNRADVEQAAQLVAGAQRPIETAVAAVLAALQHQPADENHHSAPQEIKQGRDAA
jgi:hypothetical protein